MSDAKHWDAKWATQNKSKKNNFAKRAYALMKQYGLRTILDIGCGDGRDSLYFANQGLQVTAVDFAENTIRKLKENNTQISWLSQDIREIAFDTNSFDAVYAHLSIQYFNDKITEHIFNALYDILKKGGLVFIKCKSTDDPLFGKGDKMGQNMYMTTHLRHFFSKNYMVEKLKKFHLLNIRKTTSVYEGRKSCFIEAVAIK
ncbi:MAG: class I SAM-dependent methyltransferase [Gammaproteobacteria bacterium]|jgi:ubiquinone/menaquinone biosynthesis C-methylase UbiE